MIGLTESAAQQYGSAGLRINAVLPGGVVNTPMVAARRAVSGDSDAQYLARVGGVMPRIGDPIEVARATLWLCSDQASYVTGHSLVADGGYLVK